MGLKVYPGEIQSFASDISSNVESLAGGLEEALVKIEDFETEKNLDGVAWSGTKEQLASYKYVIQGIIAASDMMREDAGKLASGAGNEQLDEDELRDKLISLQSIRGGLTTTLHTCQANNGRVMADGTVLDYTPRITMYTGLLNSTIHQIHMCEDKLERLRIIENNTSSLFQGAITLFSAVESVNASLSGSWNGSAFTAAPSAEAIEQIKGGWETTKTVRELRRLGVTMEQYWNMERLGYTADEIQLLVLCCETEEDREFLANLMEEDYIKAFAITPGKLSEGMSVIMAEYAARLAELSIVEDGCKKLQDFINAIYQFETTTAPLFKHTTQLEGYLSRLYAGSQVLLEANSYRILTEEVGDDIKERSYLLMAMSSLWGSQYQIYSEADFKGSLAHNFSGLKMEGLKYDEIEHIFSFDLLYEVDTGKLVASSDLGKGYEVKMTGHESGRWTVSADVFELPSDLDHAELSDSLRQLYEERENLMSECFLNGVTNAAIAVISTFNFPLGTALGLMKAGIQSDWENFTDHSVDGVKELNGYNRNVQSSAGAIGEIAKGLEEYFTRSKEIEEAIADKKSEYWLNIFGAGGGYDLEAGGETETYVLYKGVHNPDTLEKLRKWQENGLVGLDSSLTGQEWDDILQRIRGTDIVKSNAEILLKGGDIYGMDPKEFSKAAKEVENAIGVKKGNSNWSLESYFGGSH